MSQVTKVTNLFLKYNKLKPAGAKWLVPVLTRCPFLRQVHLRDCHLEPEGCMAIALALQKREGVVVDVRGMAALRTKSFQGSCSAFQASTCTCTTGTCVTVCMSLDLAAWT